MAVPLEWLNNGLWALAGAVVWGTLVARPGLREALDATLRLFFVGLLVIFLGAVASKGLDIFWILRMVAWLAFFWLPIHLAVVAVVLARISRWPALASAVVALGVSAFAVDAFLVEPVWLVETRSELRSPRITRPVRLLVVSDFQTDRFGDYERDVMARLAAAAPDLVVWPGDFVQLFEPRPRAEVSAEFTAAVARIPRPPLGAYAVDGNMELGFPDWPDLFQGTAVEPLTTRTSIRVGEITVTGLPFAEGFDTEVRVPREPGFHLVFAHGPDFSLGRVDADLLVAGHTHGGQVQLPFIGPLITFSKIPRAWASGWTDLPSGARLFVSRGIGHERHFAPRLRFNCRPELAWIDLLPE